MKTEEGPGIRIDVEMNSVFQLVKSILENTESKQHSDQYNHQNDARAQHAHPSTAAHLLISSLLLRVLLDL